MADLQLVNGVQISWGSLKFKLDGTPYWGITSVAYGDAMEVAKSYGIGRHMGPRGRSAGKYTPDPLVLSVATATAEEIRAQLAQQSPSGNSFGRPIVPAVLQYVELDETPITVEFEQVRLVKCSVSHQEGAETLNEDLEFDVMRLRRNARVLWDDRKG